MGVSCNLIINLMSELSLVTDLMKKQKKGFPRRSLRMPSAVNEYFLDKLFLQNFLHEEFNRHHRSALHVISSSYLHGHGNHENDFLPPRLYVPLSQPITSMQQEK